MKSDKTVQSVVTCVLFFKQSALFQNVDQTQLDRIESCCSPRADAALQFLLVSRDLSKPISHGLASSVTNYDANWREIHSRPLKEV